MTKEQIITGYKLLNERKEAAIKHKRFRDCIDKNEPITIDGITFCVTDISIPIYSILTAFYEAQINKLDRMIDEL